MVELFARALLLVLLLWLLLLFFSDGLGSSDADLLGRRTGADLAVMEVSGGEQGF